MKLSKSILLGILVLTAVGCNYEKTVSNTTDKPVNHSSEVMQYALRAHLEFLADDLLKGRETGSAETS